MLCQLCGYTHPEETDCIIALNSLLQILVPRGKLIKKAHKNGMYYFIVREYSNSFLGKISYKYSLPFCSTILSSSWGHIEPVTAHRAVRSVFISRYDWKK